MGCFFNADLQDFFIEPTRWIGMVDVGALWSLKNSLVGIWKMTCLLMFFVKIFKNSCRAYVSHVFPGHNNPFITRFLKKRKLFKKYPCPLSWCYRNSFIAPGRAFSGLKPFQPKKRMKYGVFLRWKFSDSCDEKIMFFNRRWWTLKESLGDVVFWKLKNYQVKMGW